MSDNSNDEFLRHRFLLTDKFDQLAAKQQKEGRQQKGSSQASKFVVARPQ